MVAAVAGISIALSVVRGLIRLHGRVDGILAVKATAGELPFQLIPTPHTPDVDEEVVDEFFFPQPGNTLRQLSDADRSDAQKVRLHQVFELVYEADGLSEPLTKRTGPQLSGLSNSEVATVTDAYLKIKGMAGGQQVFQDSIGDLKGDDALAYYVVGSARLSNNPAFARMLLATADVLLEVAGENAGLLVSDPKTAGVIQTAIDEFAGKHDFDDDTAGMIFRKLLTAASVTLETHRHIIADDRAGKALVEALSELRQNPPTNPATGAPYNGDEFVAGLLTRGGFERLLASFMTNLANDPHFSATDNLLRQTIGTVLKEVAEALPDGLTRAEGLQIVEATVGVVAENLETRQRLRYETGGKTYSIGGYVLTILLDEIGTAAGGGALAAKIKDGSILGVLYEAVLKGFADRPDLIANSAGDDAATRAYIKDMVTGLLPILQDQPFGEAVSSKLLERIVAKSLAVTANHADILTGENGYAAKVVEAALRTAAPLVSGGLTGDEITSIVDAAVGAAAANLNMVDMSDDLRPLAEAFAASLTAGSIADLRSRDQRIAVAKAFLVSLADNPKTWQRLSKAIGHGQTDVAKPVLEGLVAGIAAGGGDVLTGPIMQQAVQRSIGVALNQADLLIDRKMDEAVLQSLGHALTQSARDIVAVTPGVGADMLPRLLQGALTGFLNAVAANPDVLGVKEAFAKAMISATLKTAAPLVGDGISQSDLAAIVRAGFDAARENTGLIDMPDTLRPVAQAFAEALTFDSLSSLDDPDQRRAVALVFLRSLGDNPAMWQAMSQLAGDAPAEILKPLYGGVVHAVAENPRGVLTGPYAADAVRRAIRAGLPHAQLWIDGKVGEPVVVRILSGALVAVDDATAVALRRETVPLFMARVFSAALEEAIALPDAVAVDATLTDAAISDIAQDVLNDIAN